MAADEEGDPFGSIISFCQPTASQEVKFQICPLARESENFADSNPDPFSSSPDPTPSEPTGILMLSLPDSANSVEQPQEDDPVFHTPPEQYFHSHLSSSEDQNPDVPFVEGARVVNLGDDSDESKKIGISEGRLHDELMSENIRVPGEELEEDTVPIGETVSAGETFPTGETEAIVIESDGNESVNDDEVIVLDSADSDEETATVSLGEDSAARTGEYGDEVSKTNVLQNSGEEKGVGESGELLRNGVPVVNFVHEEHESIKTHEFVKDTAVEKNEKSCESNSSDGSLGSHKIEEDIVNLKHISRNGYVTTREEGGVRGSHEAAATENQKTSKDGGQGTGGEKIQGIDKFKYGNGVGIGNKWKEKAGGTGGVAGRKRQLPASVKGKEKNVEGRDVADSVETKSGLLDLLDVLKVVCGDRDSVYEDVDFLETAKKRGLTFPRPRWWPPDGDEEQQS